MVNFFVFLLFCFYNICGPGYLSSTTVLHHHAVYHLQRLGDLDIALGCVTGNRGERVGGDMQQRAIVDDSVKMAIWQKKEDINLQ